VGSIEGEDNHQQVPGQEMSDSSGAHEGFPPDNMVQTCEHGNITVVIPPSPHRSSPHAPVAELSGGIKSQSAQLP
jgi:hypothetical protein